jgi:hypothetical protein
MPLVLRDIKMSVVGNHDGRRASLHAVAFRASSKFWGLLLSCARTGVQRERPLVGQLVQTGADTVLIY